MVLLCVDYVCARHAIAVPWDEVAEMVEPYLTGEAIKQHLVKIYRYREIDGHKVPPKLDRNQRRKAFAAGGHAGGVSTDTGMGGSAGTATGGTPGGNPGRN